MKHLMKMLLALLSLAAPYARAQEGIVHYERFYYWVKIGQKMPYLSQEEKDRMKMTFSRWEEDQKGEPMKLIFSPDASLYTYGRESGETDDGQWSWRQDEFMVYHDFKNEKTHELVEMLSRTYVLEDSLRTPRWKILNQVKEIAGYVCMKAEARDTVRGQTITAWFADKLPAQAGPERYFGLPGLILELDVNDGDVILTAKSVELKPVAGQLKLPRMKGRKINEAAFQKLIADHIADAIKQQRNPYWSIRY